MQKIFKLKFGYISYKYFELPTLMVKITLTLLLTYRNKLFKLAALYNSFGQKIELEGIK